jgi:hypothetical protein
MKNARRLPARRDRKQWLVFFITHFTGTSDSFERFHHQEKSFRNPGPAQMGDEKRPGARALDGLTGFQRFSSPG